MTEIIGFLKFEKEYIPGRKTPIVRVFAKKDNTVLGGIAWFAQWRRFVFYPDKDTLFDVGCLKDIAEYISKLK